MVDFVKDILAAWPYWVPVLTFFIGIRAGSGGQREENRRQLGRLTEQIDIPEEWRKGIVDISLDGQPLGKPEMSKAGLLIRSCDGHGSGVCISSDGIILTNAHVVGTETTVEIEDGRCSYLGRVIKRCDKRDVALIRINGSASLVAEAAECLPAVGDDLYVSGAPWAMENKSMLTRGVVSKHADFEGLPYILTDASIAPGNSGGPVFDSLGRLVGITVAIQMTADHELSHIGLIIPIHEALKSMMIKAETTKNEGSSAEAEIGLSCSR